MTPERWRQIEDLYNLASDRGPEVLANADPEIRREVEALLGQEPGENIFDRPAFDLLNSASQAAVTAGSQWGPQRIEALLGQGGMGRVYRATDTRLAREVAIKLSDEQFTNRFEREARAIAALNHPNICTLFDVGPNYLVMELVAGETLAARLKRGKLSLDQATQQGAQIAGALSAAHAKGIVHRDLKPGNIMLAKSGVKVLDFGLAKSPQDDTLTMANAVMGNGSSPMWRRDGRELYYAAEDGKLMSVLLPDGAGFQAGVPKVLFQAPRGAAAGTWWSPSPDGKRFLFLVPEKQDAAPITVVLNWQAGLPR